MRPSHALPHFAIVSILSLMLPLGVYAQAAAAPQAGAIRGLITQPVDETKLTKIPGSTHPFARPKFDQGAAPGSLPANRILLVLKRSPEQEAALQQLLEEQQDNSSPNYHHWLTPQQFGQQFGPADDDTQAITSWLESHGFQVARVSNGRTVVEFSGTAAQVKEAFHSEIHKYSVNGEQHWANSADPEIPTALAPAIRGLATLHDFLKKPQHVLGAAMSRTKEGGVKPAGGAGPLFTIPGACGVDPNNCFGVGPYDFATIYNLLPLWNATPPIVGTGVTIAIVGRSDIHLSDVSDFRSYFGLPANTGNPPVITVDGTDPGFTDTGDEEEAVLDVEWSGTVAQNAKINLVVSASTITTDGVDLSAEYIVDNNLAPIMSVSFGACEYFLGNPENQFWNNLWQEAAALGITVFVSSGDSGAAGCNSQDAIPPAPATRGLAVNGLASTPYNVAVGGTDFNDAFNPTTFWNLTNASNTHESARGYIPETTWNDMCTNPVFAMLNFSSNAETTCNDPRLNPFFISTLGGSGGKSSCITATGQTEQTCSAGYPKPSWQTGTGVPNDGVRDLPDVSLFAAIGGPSGSFLIICEADLLPPGVTSCDSTDPNTGFLAIGGTSASSPSFAGIMALVEQQTGSREGNPNYALYKLAEQPGATCTSAANPVGSCIFYDIPAGGTIATPCATGSLNCNTSVPTDAYGILAGYNTGAGYDLATGLGSVNVNNLVKKWTSAKFTASSVALTLNGGNPVNVTHGTAVNVSVAVTPNSPEPTGNVALFATVGGSSSGFDTMTLTGGSASGSTNMLPGGTNYTVQAHYSGDGSYGGADSNAVSVTVNPEPSNTNLNIVTTDANGRITNSNATTFAYGSPYFLRANVTNGSGTLCFNATNKTSTYACPTGTVAITDNGGPLGPGPLALNSEGYADYLAIQLTGGSHTLGGNYSGDNSYLASPGTNPVTVTPAPTTSVVTSPVASIPPQQVLIGATMPINLQAMSNSSGVAPTGTFTVFDGSTPLTGPVTTSGFTVPNANEVFLNGTLFASISPPSGMHSLSTHYSGDANYAPSTSPVVSVSAVYGTQTMLTPSSFTIPEGQSVTLTAAVTPNPSTNVPMTGTVTFASGFTPIATVNVSNGQAQFATSSLVGGADFISAAYSGDSNFASSNGSTQVNVTPIGTTTSLTSSNLSITQGTPITLTAQISPARMGVAPPGGSVQFTVGGTPFATANVSNNQAKVSGGFSQTGSVQIQASYSGDQNYLPSSATVTETVTPAPDFALSASPGTVTISAPGGSGMTMLTVSTQNGFTGTVTFACSGLPSESTCNASSVNGSGTTTLTVMTTAPSMTAPRTRPNRIGGPAAPRQLLLIALCILVLTLLTRRQEQRRITALALLAFASMAMIAACGGGGGGGAVRNPGTPIGTTTAMVTGTGTVNGSVVTHAIPVTINVQ